LHLEVVSTSFAGLRSGNASAEFKKAPFFRLFKKKEQD
jgi:hypothetical protein